MNDKKIVQLFFERSQQAITELSLKYGKICFHIALNILKCNEDAEECENDTYLKTWNSIPPDDPMCLRAYVSRIVRNLALSKYRYNHRQMRDSHLQVYLSELQDCIPASQDVEASADPETRMHRERAEIFRFSLLLHLKKLQRDAKKLLMFREWKAAVNATEQVPQRVQARKPASIAAAEVL